MKQFAVLSLIGALTLASCNQAAVVGSTKTYTFAAPATAVAGYTAQAGTAAKTDLSTKDTATVLMATGLKPSTAYVAHYHLAGTDTSQGVCASNGAIVDGMIGGMSFTTDGSGALTIKGLTATANIASAKYINIHEAAALSVVPLCADLTVTK